MQKSKSSLRFGPFELRPGARELYKHGVKLRLRPQPFQVLHILLQNPGEVVTRERLHSELWPADTFVDFEHGLNTSIKELRGVLGDSASNPRYVETLPRLGYRIIVPVTAVEAVLEPREAAPTSVAAPAFPAPAEREPAPAVVTQHWKNELLAWNSRVAWLAIAAAITLAAAGYFSWSRYAHRRGHSGNYLMLAVLPFENLTGDPGQDYVSEGMTEEMIAQLGRVDPERLGVIARTSVMKYQRSEHSVETVGKELGAQYVLEGSVRRDGDKVRVNAELVQVKDQTRLWAREYDRQLSSLLTLQGEIAQEIADEIEVALGSRQSGQSIRLPASAPEPYEAYDFYLRGRFFWNKRTEKGFEQASQSFQQAIARDPSFARAYAGLADSYALTGAYGIQPPDEIMPKARNVALTALRLDEGLAEAHASLAVIAQNYDWDWETAEKEYRRAIQLNPNYATAHHWYAEYLGLQGRFDESSVEFAKARKLDPLSLIMATDNAVMLYLSRQYDRAIEQFRVVQSMEPEFPRVHTLASAYAAKGAYKEALADIAAWQNEGGEIWATAESGYVYARAGRREEALKVLELLRRRDHQKPINPLLFATVYTGLGDKENAIAMLGKACDAHSASLTALGVDPMFDGLRGDAKFQELLRRLHLAR